MGIQVANSNLAFAVNDEAQVNNIRAIHHLEFCVGNALQSAFWYCFHFGFRRFAHLRRDGINYIAIRNGTIILVFKGIMCKSSTEFSLEEYARHGDFVKEVCFEVDNMNEIYKTLIANNCEIIMQPTIFSDSNQNGSIQILKVKSAAGSIVHKLVKNIDYTGVFMPDFLPIDDYSFCQKLPLIPFLTIDHIVEGHNAGGVKDVVQMYKKTLGLVKFWTADESVIKAKFGALNAVILGTDDRLIQIVLAEPGKLKLKNSDSKNPNMKGQLQEFIDYNDGPGIQHFAFLTDDICAVVEQMRERGVEFLPIKAEYYIDLRKRLAITQLNILEDINRIEKLNILIDFDAKGYLLQIFTKPVQDRPTLFIEIIERHNFVGFGAGNFNGLFAAVEAEQLRRSNEFKIEKFL